MGEKSGQSEVKKKKQRNENNNKNDDENFCQENDDVKLGRGFVFQTIDDGKPWSFSSSSLRTNSVQNIG